MFSFYSYFPSNCFNNSIILPWGRAVPESSCRFRVLLFHDSLSFFFHGTIYIFKPCLCQYFYYQPFLMCFSREKKNRNQFLVMDTKGNTRKGIKAIYWKKSKNFTWRRYSWKTYCQENKKNLREIYILWSIYFPINELFFLSVRNMYFTRSNHSSKCID